MPSFQVAHWNEEFRPVTNAGSTGILAKPPTQVDGTSAIATATAGKAQEAATSWRQTGHRCSNDPPACRDANLPPTDEAPLMAHELGMQVQWELVRRVRVSNYAVWHPECGLDRSARSGGTPRPIGVCAVYCHQGH